MPRTSRKQSYIRRLSVRVQKLKKAEIWVVVTMFSQTTVAKLRLIKKITATQSYAIFLDSWHEKILIFNFQGVVNLLLEFLAKTGPKEKILINLGKVT